MSEDSDLKVIEAIYDALDGGRPDQALELAERTLAGLPDDDPVLRFLAGRALMELECPDEAALELSRAVELDPDDAEFRTDLAECLYLRCRFAEAYEQAHQGCRLDDDSADAHYVLALLLERRSETSEAEFHFARASALDGGRFPRPCRVDGPEFERQLLRARELLPEQFGKHLERVGLIVEELPSDSLLHEERPPLDPELLGLFAGVAIDGDSYLSAGGELPPRIYLFKRNLERMVTGPDELAEQIRVTLYHELGHYLGMDEEDLEQAGYA